MEVFVQLINEILLILEFPDESRSGDSQLPGPQFYQKNFSSLSLAVPSLWYSTYNSPK
jgi:hypothetical protein